MKKRLGILLSGRGSNFQAIHRAILSGSLTEAEIACVLSNKADAPGLDYARAEGIPAFAFKPKDFPDFDAYECALLERLQEHGADLLILAGYARILGPVLLEAFTGRILNIHPSLLPAYGGKGMVGLKVHQAVIENREKRSGCTVHLVTAEVDGGPILGQAEVEVCDTDTPESLAEKVLQQEHRLYARVIGEVIRRETARSIPNLP